jgi:hypothetical protein
VASIGKLDVLPAGQLDPQTRIDPMQIRQLISFARRFYSSICIDLSGNMEKFSIEVMQDAKKIFIVCTPEIPSLHLARQNLSLLQSMDLGDKVAILMNRALKAADHQHRADSKPARRAGVPGVSERLSRRAQRLDHGTRDRRFDGAGQAVHPALLLSAGSGSAPPGR